MIKYLPGGFFCSHMPTWYEGARQWPIVKKEASLQTQVQLAVRAHFPTQRTGPLLVVFFWPGLPVMVAVDVSAHSVHPGLTQGRGHTRRSTSAYHVLVRGGRGGGRRYKREKKSKAQRRCASMLG